MAVPNETGPCPECGRPLCIWENIELSPFGRARRVTCSPPPLRRIQAEYEAMLHRDWLPTGERKPQDVV